MNNTLHDDYRRVSVTNKEYHRNRDRWEFLLHSYIGGEEYRRQGYLTRYQLESNSQYQQRLITTPLDNHVQNVVDVYTSFLFREDPDRDFEDWEDMPDVEQFLNDCDMEGRDFDAFMKEVATWSSVFGHVWIIMTKPNVQAQSLGEEQSMGVRPYVNLVTPLVVSDWTWTRRDNGSYELTYLKYIEEVVDKTTTVREWTKDVIRTWTMDDEKKTAELMMEEVNQLGMIPAVVAYNKRSVVKGIGVSDISDVADLQRLIYNYNSEIEQAHRMAGHPSLVVTPDTQYGNGAGAVIVVPENSDPGLKPYVLEFNGANIASLHDSINQLVSSIDRLSNTGGVRGRETRTLSGVAMEVEFSLLAARLSAKSDMMELAEEQLWKLFGLYQNREWSGEVEYSGNFNIRDVQREFQQLQTAKGTATNPMVLEVIDKKLLELLDEEMDDEEYAITATTATATAVAPMDVSACPIATQDVAVNLANRQNAIDTANYGPLNPSQPNRVFWARLADKWSVSEDSAKQSRCGNCAAFVQTPAILDCIDAGLAAGSRTGNEWDTIAAGDLGYCEAFDFKCAANRTCDSWITGGPVV